MARLWARITSLERLDYLSLAKAPRCSNRKSSTCSNFNAFCSWGPQLPRGVSSAQHPVCQEHHRRHLLCALLTAQPPFFLGTPLAQPPEEALRFSQSSLGRGAAHQSRFSCQSSKDKCGARFQAPRLERMALSSALLLWSPRQCSCAQSVTKATPLSLASLPPLWR